MEASIPANENERLLALRRYAIMDSPGEPAFDRLASLAARLFQVPVAMISLVDENRQWFKACYGTDIRELDRKVAFCAHALHSSEVMVVPDTTLDPRSADNPLVTGWPGVRFYAGAPLLAPGGERLGTLCILDLQPREFPPVQQQNLADLAALAVSELEHRLAGRDLQREIEQRQESERLLEERVAGRTRDLAQANLSLREAEAKARDIIEHAVEGVFQTAPAGHFLSANPALARLYGYDSVLQMIAELTSVGDQLYVDPASRAQFVQQLAEQGEITGHESEVRRRDGERIWISETAREVRNAAGELQYYEGMVKNITGRKATERALQENRAWLESRVLERTADLERTNAELRAEIAERHRVEEALHLAAAENSRLTTAIESSDVGLLISDPLQPDAPTIYVNRAFERITGYQAAEVIGRNCRFLQGAETSTEMISQIRQSVAQRQTFRGLILNYKKDGTPFWNELIIDPVFDEAGQLVNFVGLQNDVTERVRSVEELHQKEKALRESEERLQAILDENTALVYMYDLEGRYMLVNRRLETVFGRPKEAILGRRAAEIAPASTAEEWSRNNHAVLLAQHPIEFEETLELADGRHTYLSVKFPLRDSEGRAYAICGVSSDITERKRYEAALRESKEEAERANQAKSDFLSRMSHELRTPLNAILGFSQLLEMQPLSVSDAENVEFISKAGRHLLDLINEVLDLARIEAGRVVLSPEPVEVRDLMEEVLSLVRPEAEKRGLTLRLELTCGEGAYVEADRQRVKQILLNLLSNAVKYNRPRGTVDFSCAEDRHSRLRFQVADTGRGIPPEKFAGIFVPFERMGAEFSEVEGTGIGLAISQRLARLQGGEIEVESVVGKGSVFSLRLPRAEKPLDPMLAAVRRTVLEAPQPATRQRHRVLYIEDNDANLELMQKVVAKHPRWNFLAAHDGEEGLCLARAEKPDLILLDLHLPGASGETVLRQLRAERPLAETPVVIVSADAMSQQVLRLLSAGAQAYLTKPIDIAEVLELLDLHARTADARG